VSQGQRFRRRALRRGYKVDEVDSFLDRVEGTLAGDPMGAPVSAQEVHDVVFRVRYGGYDEWQVDLHLDRVERQLAELEERGGPFPRPAEMRMPPPDRPERQERMGPPPDRMGPPPDRMMPERIPPDRVAPVDRIAPPMPPMAPPQMPSRPMPPVPSPPREPSFGRYDDQPTYGGGNAYDNGYDPNRHARADMTHEIRMDRGDRGGMDRGGMDRGGMDRGGMDRGGMDRGGADRGMPEPSYGGDPGYGAAPMSTEAARVDQLRRTFQLRRFGSGYDRVQVDRVFDGVIAALSGRGSVNEAELDPSHFNLVPGGYFEAEVDAAMKEVRDILMRLR
jgi:DivIVA domain-containing protein